LWRTCKVSLDIRIAIAERVHYHAHMRKEQAVAKALSNLDSDFVRACNEPARIEILKHLIVNGPSDIKTLAARMPQDRSVISRHLSVLHLAGLLRREKSGRHSLYSVDGENTLRMAEQFADTIRECVELGCC